MTQYKPNRKDISFARRLKRMRKKAGFTQEQLADKTRLSTTFIGLLETSRRRPSMKTLQRIASALGVKAKDLLPFQARVNSLLCLLFTVSPSMLYTANYYVSCYSY